MTTNTRRQPGLTRYFIACLAVALPLFAVSFSNIAEANAHQPYGGCKEAYAAPKSPGARHCRQHGWIVRKRIVVKPNGYVVFNRLRPCKYEDSKGCYWNARKRGNSMGHSYVNLRRKDGGVRVRYVQTRSLR